MNKCKLGELLKIKHGFAFKSENYVDISSYALVTLANISESNNFQFNPGKTTYYGSEFPKEFELRTDDLIMPLTEQVIGLFGNSAFVPKIGDIKFVLNQRVGKVIPIEGKADKYYLHYLLSTRFVREQLEYRASGTKQRNISPDDVYDVTVIVPDIIEQERIGKTLYLLEQKVNLNNQINDNLQQLVQTIYDYWFTQFDFPDENGKPYRSSGGKMVWDEEMKCDIPESWKIFSISDFAEIESGYSFPSESYSSTEGYKLITIKNVQDSGITINVDNYIPEIPLDMPDYCQLKKGDILLSLTGNVGRVGLMFSDDCLLNQRVALIQSKDISLSPFLYALFKNPKMRLKMERMATGTSQKNLSPVDTENIQIAADKAITKQFCIKTKPLIDMILSNLKENAELEQLRDWLLPMLMNGQATIAD